MPPSKKPAPKYATIQQAIVAAAAAVPSPEKDGYNSFHDYYYVTAEGMIAATKAPLADAGLTVRLGGLALGDVNGDIWPIRIQFLLEWDGGETVVSEVEYPAIRGKGRPFDKAINGALTNALSYWLRGLLNIPRGLADDAQPIDARDDTATGDGETVETPHGGTRTRNGEDEHPTDELHRLLTDIVHVKRADVIPVLQLLSEIQGVPSVNTWAEVKEAQAAQEVVQSLRDWLTSVEPGEIISRAHARATERGAAA
jgi:hypothetical protein